MSAAEHRVYREIYGEVSACAGHTHHGACNCARTVACIMQRLQTDLRPWVAAWLGMEKLDDVAAGVSEVHDG